MTKSDLQFFGNATRGWVSYRDGFKFKIDKVSDHLFECRAFAGNREVMFRVIRGTNLRDAKRSCSRWYAAVFDGFFV